MHAVTFMQRAHAVGRARMASAQIGEPTQNTWTSVAANTHVSYRTQLRVDPLARDAGNARQ